MTYKRAELALHFGRDSETIRRWTNEFSEYLSIAAQSKTKSSYEHSDVERLTLVRDMLESGSSNEQIHLALKAGQTGHFDGFLKNGRVQLSEGQVEQLAIIAQERDELRQEVQELKQALAKANARADLVADKDAEIARLNREIGRLEERLNKPG